MAVDDVHADWAPEMIMKDSKGHRIRYNQCVDWFSFGTSPTTTTFHLPPSMPDATRPCSSSSTTTSTLPFQHPL